MEAAGVNPSDTYLRLGMEGPYAAVPHLLPQLPWTPGKDGAGIVEAVGEESTTLAVGQRVKLGQTVDVIFCLLDSFGNFLGILSIYNMDYRGRDGIILFMVCNFAPLKTPPDLNTPQNRSTNHLLEESSNRMPL